MQLLFLCAAAAQLLPEIRTGFLAGLELDRCDTAMLAQLNDVANLASCFRRSLFFSPLATVCSPPCLTATVAASALVTAACRIALPEDGAAFLNSQSHLAYAVWANTTQAGVACAANQRGSGYCLGDLMAAQVASAASCTPCNRHMYAAFVAAPNAIPAVYYYTLVDAPAVLRGLQATCGW